MRQLANPGSPDKWSSTYFVHACVRVCVYVCVGLIMYNMCINLNIK